MTTRRLEISNYRNLGIGKPITFNLDVLGGRGFNYPYRRK